MGAVYLKVKDLENSVKFYREVIGFKILKQTEYTVELTADGHNSLVILEKIPNAVILPRKNTTGPREEWTYDAQGRVKMAVDPIEWQGLIDEAGDAEWNGLAQGTVMGHVHLHVADLKQAEQFYVGILGFDIMAHMANSALFISAGGYHHHLGMNVWAGIGAPQPPDNAAGLLYYTIVLPNKEGLDSVLTKLRDAEIVVESHEAGWFVEDPSKNCILLVSQGPYPI